MHLDESSPLPMKELMTRLEIDPWRETEGFSSDLAEVNTRLWASTDETAARHELLTWLGHWQPCLFGRVAARKGAIATCILFEDQLLTLTDDEISDLIQTARQDWTREGFNGGSSGFVILLVSQKLAMAKPDKALFDVAQKLCQLYLLRDDIEVDKIYHDEVFLEAANRERSAWKWLAGINFFGACGDKRWWLDHRIPGGIALSVNSVGHLIKSRILDGAERDYDHAIDVDGPDDELGKIDSLPKALEWAMRTIKNATATPCGHATYLVARSQDTGAPPCKLPSVLEGYDHRFYEGYYHTDFTLPSIYFIPDVRRPEISPTQLDLTYLTDTGASNPDHTLMGRGRRIRQAEEHAVQPKRELTEPEEIAIDDFERLSATLNR